MSDDRPVLTCGTAVEDLIAAARDGLAPTAHEATCPSCQAVLGELEPLRRRLGDLRAEPLAVPPGLAARVMRRVRALPRPARSHAELAGPRGRTLIADGVVLDLAHGAAGRTGAAVLGAELDFQGDRTRVRLRVVVPYGPDAHVVAERVRRAVAGTLARLAGLDGVQVDVEVADVR